jgi:hypothetical protein
MTKRSTALMTVTAFVETATGLLLLIWPALLFALLFGWRQVTPEALLIGRLAGAGVISIGVACWPARRDTHSPGQLGVLAGVLTYNVLAALLLAFAGAGLKMAGVLLWPAVVYHSALAAWSVACLPRRQEAERL